MYIIEVLPNNTNKNLFVKILNENGLWSITAKENATTFNAKEIADQFIKENYNPNEYQFHLHICATL